MCDPVWCFFDMSVRTVLEMFDERVAASGDAVALRTRRDGRWTSMTWNEWYAAVDRFARTLVGLGVEPGDRVLLLARNRVEWLVADLAIMQVGAVCVPIFHRSLPRHVAWTVNHAQARFAVAEDPHQVEKLVAMRAEMPHLERVVLMDDIAQLDNPDRQGRAVVSLKDLSLTADEAAWVVDTGAADELAATIARVDPNQGQARRRALSLDDLATIVYSSGTTGTPRGVMLTHGNLAAEVIGNALALPLKPDDRQLLLLPLSQVFARAIYLTSIHVGCAISFSRGFSHLRTEFEEEKPTFFVGVPLVFSRIAWRFIFNKGNERNLIGGSMRGMAKLAQKRAREQQGVETLNWAEHALLKVGDRTLFRRAREAFGGHLRFAICGGAPMAQDASEVFRGMGVPILEGYGLTETSGAATTNRPNQWRLGSAGLPLRDVEIKIADDGEILLRGPIVSPGYWGDQEATDEAWKDGWFHTGDVGALLDGGFLQITDRKKDVIVLRTGRSVSPARVESQLESIQLVQRAVVAGDGEDHLVALISLDKVALEAFAAARKLRGTHEDLCLRDEVYEEMRQQIDRVNSDLRTSEQVVRFAIVPRSFSPETGELTPTYRVRRRFVLEKYRGVLEGLRTR